MDDFAEYDRLACALGLASLPGSSLYSWLRLSLAEAIFSTGNIYITAPTISALIVVGATGVNQVTDFVRRLTFSQVLSARHTVL